MIKFTKQAENVAAGVGVSIERRNQLVDAFFQQVQEWHAAENEDTTGQLFDRAMDLAQDANEQCYICYTFGRFVGMEYSDTAVNLVDVLRAIRRTNQSRV